MPAYEVQILVNEKEKNVWKSIRPSNGEPYRFKSENSAYEQLIRNYPYGGRRIIRTEQNPNIGL